MVERKKAQHAIRLTEKSSMFTFINHASYTIQTAQSVLLVDPWVEGYAFDKGWALLDKSTSNERLLSFLSSLDKKIYLWISHEHSDHFSVSFLLSLKKAGIEAKFYFQKTTDGRMAEFIRQQGFQIKESNDKLEYIDPDLSLVTFPYSGGDSFCLTLVNNYSVLNINDCVISNNQEALSIVGKYLKYTDNIDLLLTQFGYANWMGNENSVDVRIESAVDKLRSIKLQTEYFSPRYIVPFASFFYFCHPENFFINDSQNSPRDVSNYFIEEKILSELVVLKPFDNFELSKSTSVKNSTIYAKNIEHWESLMLSSQQHLINDIKYTESDFFAEYKKYRNKVFKNFAFMPALRERAQHIPCLKIFVKDLNSLFNLSYII